MCVRPRRPRTDVAEAHAALKKKQNEIQRLEVELEAKHTCRNFPLASLGHEKKNCGGAKGWASRLEVLGRLACLGNGLSQQQKNDWAWWKEAWDEQMMSEHVEAWPWMFASWVQKTLDDIEGGDRSAFSNFVHAEMERCFGDDPALRMPGLG